MKKVKVTEEQLKKIAENLVEPSNVDGWIEKGDISALAHHYSKADEPGKAGIISKATTSKGEVFANRIKVRAQNVLEETEEIVNEEQIDETSTTGSVGGQYSSKYFLAPKGKERKDIQIPGGAIVAPNPNTHINGVNSYKITKGSLKESMMDEYFDTTLLSQPKTQGFDVSNKIQCNGLFLELSRNGCEIDEYPHSLMGKLVQDGYIDEGEGFGYYFTEKGKQAFPTPDSFFGYVQTVEDKASTPNYSVNENSSGNEVFIEKEEMKKININEAVDSILNTIKEQYGITESGIPILDLNPVGGMDEDIINELSPETLKAATNKAMHGDNNTAGGRFTKGANFFKHMFRGFMGRNLSFGTITGVNQIGNAEDGFNLQIDGEEVTMVTYHYVARDENEHVLMRDQHNTDWTLLRDHRGNESVYNITRSDAVILLKMIKISNPNSRLSPNSFSIKNDHTMEETTGAGMSSGAFETRLREDGMEDDDFGMVGMEDNTAPTSQESGNYFISLEDEQGSQLVEFIEGTIEEADLAANKYRQEGHTAQVYSLDELKQEGIDPSDESFWADSAKEEMPNPTGMKTAGMELDEFESRGEAEDDANYGKWEAELDKWIDSSDIKFTMVIDLQNILERFEAEYGLDYERVFEVLNAAGMHNFDETDATVPPKAMSNLRDLLGEFINEHHREMGGDDRYMSETEMEMDNEPLHRDTSATYPKQRCENPNCDGEGLISHGDGSMEDCKDCWGLNEANVIEEEFVKPSPAMANLNKIKAENERITKAEMKKAGNIVKKAIKTKGTQFVQEVPGGEEVENKSVDNTEAQDQINLIRKGMEDLHYDNEQGETFDDRFEAGIDPNSVAKSAAVTDQHGNKYPAEDHANIDLDSDLGSKMLADIKKKKGMKDESNDALVPRVKIVKENEEMVITEDENQLINEDIEKMKRLLGYKPNNYVSTKGVTTNNSLFKRNK